MGEWRVDSVGLSRQVSFTSKPPRYLNVAARTLFGVCSLLGRRAQEGRDRGGPDRDHLHHTAGLPSSQQVRLWSPPAVLVFTCTHIRRRKSLETRIHIAVVSTYNGSVNPGPGRLVAAEGGEEAD